MRRNQSESDRMIRRASVAAVERLEDRQLLAFSLGGDGVLTITAAGKDDVIHLRRVSTTDARIRVQANKAVKFFQISAVDEIVINSGAGADRITISGQNGGILAPTTISGGVGNDRIQTGKGADDIDGGDGNDVILSGAGADWVEGGDGNDNVNAGHGNDHAYGGAGDDTLLGASGNDVLGGDDEGELRFKNEAIPAEVVGNDLLLGGAGDDHLLGGINSDIIDDDDNGVDTMTGGAGNDIFNARGVKQGAVMVVDDEITDAGAGDTVVTERYSNTGKIPDLNDPEPYDEHRHAVIRVYINGEEILMQEGIGDFGLPVLHRHSAAGGADTTHFHNAESTPDIEFTIPNMFTSFGWDFSNSNIGKYRGNVQARVRTFGSGDPYTLVNDVAGYEIKSTDINDTDLQEEIIIFIGDDPTT